MTTTETASPRARSTATTRAFLEETLRAHRPTGPSGILLGRLVVRVLDSGMSLREIEAASGISHPQRKLDGRRALLAEDLDALAAALHLRGGELFEPVVSDDDIALLRLIEAETRYSDDGEPVSGATVHIEEMVEARLAAQGLIAYKTGAVVSPDGARLLASLT